MKQVTVRHDGKCTIGGDTLNVRNGTPEEVAVRLSRRLRVDLVRVTGDHGLSGWWRGYRPSPAGGSVSTSIVVHIS